MPNIIIASDWHGDYVTHGVRRLADLEAAVAQVVEAVEPGDLFIFLGDLCDPDHGAATIDAISHAASVMVRLAERGAHQVWVAGNHDVVHDGSGSTVLDPLKPLADVLSRAGTGTVAFVFTCARPPFNAKADGRARMDSDLVATSVLRLPGFPDLVFLPYVSPTVGHVDYEEELRSVARDIDPTNAYVFGHLTIPGMHPGEETTEMARGGDRLFPLDPAYRFARLFNGHYHAPGVYEVDVHVGGDPQRTEHVKITIPGSLLQLSFGGSPRTGAYLKIKV